MTTNVLILCTHNSARSVLAEGMLNHLAKKLGKDVQAFSAGSTPSGRINPFALDSLTRAGVSVDGYRSKSWDEFSGTNAPAMRLVVTVCDSAAAETCPFWPGSPVQVHWGYADPSRVEGDEAKRFAFDRTREAIEGRMLALLEVPFDDLTDSALERALRALSDSALSDTALSHTALSHTIHLAAP